jgi:hypothetical protein
MQGQLGVADGCMLSLLQWGEGGSFANATGPARRDRVAKRARKREREKERKREREKDSKRERERERERVGESKRGQRRMTQMCTARREKGEIERQRF